MPRKKRHKPGPVEQQVVAQDQANVTAVLLPYEEPDPSSVSVRSVSLFQPKKEVCAEKPLQTVDGTLVIFPPVEYWVKFQQDFDRITDRIKKEREKEEYYGAVEGRYYSTDQIAKDYPDYCKLVRMVFPDFFTPTGSPCLFSKQAMTKGPRYLFEKNPQTRLDICGHDLHHLKWLYEDAKKHNGYSCYSTPESYAKSYELARERGWSIPDDYPVPEERATATSKKGF